MSVPDQYLIFTFSKLTKPALSDEPKIKTKPRIAVIGAGWAGCAAATKLAEKGYAVTLLEASRTLGGRARSVSIQGLTLDNGQHILLGAYKESLALIRQLGISEQQAFLKLPLQMCYPEGSDGMQFIAPKWPAPLHLAYALFTAKGLDRSDKLALARFSTTARWMDWQLDHDCSVSTLLQRFEQTERLCRLMWIPLCIAALNTAPERASAQVFLNVLRDSLGANRAASDMLLPKLDLSTLMPEAARAFITERGGKVITGANVTALQVEQNNSDKQLWKLKFSQQFSESSDFPENTPEIEQQWDAVILATAPSHAIRLLSSVSTPINSNIAESTEKSTGQNHRHLNTKACEFEYEAITTCYLQYDQKLKLPRAMFALIDDPTHKHWGQFVFDRGQLHAAQQGLLAVVVSAASQTAMLNHAELASDIAHQLAANFTNSELNAPLWHQVITEKRATFSCAPNLKRPSNQTEISSLMLAGELH